MITVQQPWHHYQNHCWWKKNSNRA